MGRYTVIAHFYIEADGDPEDIANEFNQGFGAFGPVQQSAAQFPSGEVLGSGVDSIREALPDEIASHFEE